jgi:hypothetical protein
MLLPTAHSTSAAARDFNTRKIKIRSPGSWFASRNGERRRLGKLTDGWSVRSSPQPEAIPSTATPSPHLGTARWCNSTLWQQSRFCHFLLLTEAYLNLSHSKNNASSYISNPKNSLNSLKVFCCVRFELPHRWSGGQSSCLQIQRSGFDSRCYQIFCDVVYLETGPLSLVSIIEEPIGEK